MDRVPRKKMSVNKKLFRVSTEVRSVLQRKHNKWSPVRAFDRVGKDLNIFYKMCKVFLTFLKKFGQDDDLASCDGRVVKIFADMVKKSLHDDGFVSGECLGENNSWFLVCRNVGLRFFH